MNSKRNKMLQRLRRARRQRGAALVEAIIVSGMLITMMAAGLFLHRLYAERIQVMHDARLAAWSQALAGCNGAVDLGAVWAGAGSGAPVDIDTESAPGFMGSVGHTSGSANGAVRAPARIGGGSYALTAQNSVACNEIAQDERGDVASLFGYISSNIVPSLF